MTYSSCDHCNGQIRGYPNEDGGTDYKCFGCGRVAATYIADGSEIGPPPTDRVVDPVPRHVPEPEPGEAHTHFLPTGQKRLTATGRQALIELHLAGMAQKDIAERLGVTGATVSQHIGSYRRRIKAEQRESTDPQLAEPVLDVPEPPTTTEEPPTFPDDIMPTDCWIELTQSLIEQAKAEEQTASDAYAAAADQLQRATSKRTAFESALAAVTNP